MKAGQSYIFRAVGAVLFFLINVFAIYLLLRGHNLPGGGFIGGLGSALSLIMLSLAFGVERTQGILRTDPVRVAGAGLLLALLTSLLPLLAGDPFLRHYHVVLPVLGKIEVGTPLLFDVGVFLVVVGVTAKLIFVLARPNADLTALAPEEWRNYAAPLEEPIEKTARSESPAPEDDVP
ncbi:MAG: MnhB domain-containing protein [Lacunisphaera sp.]|nr:MnhB domain-containing protein [Lacunisphaera sp.]